MNGLYPVPPAELVEQWVAEIWHEGTPVRVAASDIHIATQAARWGADQELEACIDWMSARYGEESHAIRLLRAARRPRPASLKEQALHALESADGADFPVVATILTADQHALIRRALGQLPD